RHERWLATADRADNAEEHSPDAELGARTDAIRQAVSGGRRGSHGSGNWRKGLEPGGGRCVSPVARVPRFLSRTPKRSAGWLLAAMPAAGLARGTFFVVDDLDAPSLP